MLIWVLCVDYFYRIFLICSCGRFQCVAARLAQNTWPIAGPSVGGVVGSGRRLVVAWRWPGQATHYYWCFHHNFHPRWRRLVLPLYLSLSRVLVCLSSTRRVLSFGDGAATAKCVRKSRPCRASRWKCVLRMRRGVVGVVDFIAATSCWFTWFIHFTVSWTHSHIYTHTRLRHTQQRWVCLGELWKSRSALTSRRLRTWFLVGYNMGLFMLCIEMRMPTICLANMK